MEKELEKLYKELKDLINNDVNDEKQIITKEKVRTETDDEKKKVYQERKEEIRKGTLDLLDRSEIVFVALGDKGVVSTGSASDMIGVIGLLINELITEFGIPKEKIYNRIEEMLED